MKTVIIRDDDSSFFTPPEHLQRVYGRLWDAGIPVSLAVIPAHRADTRVLHRVGAPFDPSIPPQFRGENFSELITENRALMAFLRPLVARGQVEICMHGIGHEYMEFRTKDHAKQRELMLKQALRIFKDAFSQVSIKTFIAPYDEITTEACSLLFNIFGWNLCTRTPNLRDFVPEMRTYQAMQLDAGNWLFTCDEYLFNHRADPQEILKTALSRLDDPAVETLVIANHYWCFFYDWVGDNRPLLAAWDQFVGELLKRDDLRFTTFADFGSSS